MKSNRLTYISVSLLAGMLLTGCRDDSFLEDSNPVGDPNAVTFEAGVDLGMLTTRGGDGEKKLYDPLELSDEKGTETLYLHTYDSEVIGESARDLRYAAGRPETRAGQVQTVDDLIKYNTDFKVHAQYQDTAEEYIEWTNGKQAGTGGQIWATERTRYWPGEKMLSFHAVSPAAEFAALQKQSIANNEYRFSYTAKKGASANRDAETQKDLMFATSVCNKQGSVNGRAPLKFHHALSAIKFAVRDVLNGEIVNIKIKGVYGSGDCVFTADNSGENGAFAWSNQAGVTDYSQNFNYVVNERGEYVNPGDESKDIVLNAKMPEKTFMLIPQAIPEGAEIEVTMKRTGLVSGSGAQATITVKARIDQNSLKEWLPGHEYIYTISTSKDNWVYVLEAFGNHNSANGRHDKDISNFRNADQIYVYSPVAEAYDTYEAKAYFQVSSYRYRANDANYREACPWVASHGDAKQYRPVGTSTQWGQYVGKERDLKAADWITDPKKLRGAGNADKSFEKHNITMAESHLMTDWAGDTWMQDNAPYSGNSKSKPWDLATAGGALSQNTANTYVIDREGWYSFPLVYGNAKKNGGNNKKAYEGNVFVDHAGNSIVKPAIDGVVDAAIVWSDVFNAISDVQVKDNKVLFKANKGNLQQGNVVIAVYDKANNNNGSNSGTVLWSWHIWINEHWLDPETGQPNAFNSSGFKTVEYAKGSGWRQRGDLKINNKHVDGSLKYFISPYNLGWCDPKNVDYLRRPGTMKFVQYMPGTAVNALEKEGRVTGKTASLPILQEGERVSYKFGNNTYYQWGRKDPMVGFVDHSSNVKRNFGPMRYKVSSKADGRAIKEGILNPHILFASDDKNDDDWLKTSRTMLWDNDDNTGQNNKKVVKTVYDPSPPGYVVPPAYCLRFIGTDANDSYENSSSDQKNLSKFNGKKGSNNFTFIACVVDKANQTKENSVWLTSTGHRWYTDKYGKLPDGSTWKAGDNFNPKIVYLGSSTPVKDKISNAYGIALGYDETYDKYVITSFFFGRKAMARPIRAIRELE
ncbi:MAG: fimbrillin family protein [Candidatus Amulumruptor caecigallinarius]|nr:fimbrillin family protein [Candidatus Amulumruptor caecigallinarius]